MEGKGRFERNLRQFRGIKIRRPGFRLAAAVLLTVLSMDVACGLLPLKGVDIRPGSSGGGQRSVNQVGEAPSGTTRSVQKWSKVPHKLWAQPSVVPVRFGQICGWIVDVKTKVGTKLSATHDKVASHVARQVRALHPTRPARASEQILCQGTSTRISRCGPQPPVGWADID